MTVTLTDKGETLAAEIVGALVGDPRVIGPEADLPALARGAIASIFAYPLKDRMYVLNNIDTAQGSPDPAVFIDRIAEGGGIPPERVRAAVELPTGSEAGESDDRKTVAVLTEPMFLVNDDPARAGWDKDLIA